MIIEQYYLFTFEGPCTYGILPHIKGHVLSVLDHQDPFQPFHNDTSRYHYIWLYNFPMALFDSAPRLYHEYHRLLAICESIFNMECHSSHFTVFTADLEPNILSSAIEWVFTALFYTTSMHLLHNHSEEVLFGHFVTMINDAFQRETGPSRWRIC